MGWAKNVIIFVVCINVFVTIFAMNLGLTYVDSNVASKFYAMGNNYTISPTQSAGSLLNNTPRTGISAASGSTQQDVGFGSWIDPLKQIYGVITLLIGLIVGIFALPFLIPSFPAMLGFMIIAPLGVAYLLAIISLIRGGDW